MEVDRSSAERAVGATPLFSRLNPAQLREIVGVGQRVTLDAGSLVVREGDDADRVYVILEGKVRVFRRDPNGNDVEIAVLQSGNIFGEYAILDGGVRSASVATITRCEFFAVDRVPFLNLLGNSPDVVGYLFSSLTATIRTSVERIVREEVAAHQLQTEMELARHRAVSELVAGVAHELNTPLGVANTAASLLKRDLTLESIPTLAANPNAERILEDVLEAASLIQRNIARADKLIQDFKKVSVSQISDPKESFNLSEAVNDIIGLFRLSARRANLRVQIHDTLVDGERAWEGYRGYLTQVLLNLLTNVERHAYPGGVGGVVRVTLARDPGSDRPSFRITVGDDGIGIPLENQPKVFDAFFTTGRAKGASGLGLTIVHNIVTTALKGSVQVDSQPGKSTAFIVTFPQDIPG